MIAPFIMAVLLIIFALGGGAIVFCLLNIFWRSYLSKNHKRQYVKPQSSAQFSEKPITLKVIERHEMSSSHFSVRLQAMHGDVLTDFLPGQYLTLMMPNQSVSGSS